MDLYQFLFEPFIFLLHKITSKQEYLNDIEIKLRFRLLLVNRLDLLLDYASALVQIIQLTKERLYIHFLVS